MNVRQAIEQAQRSQKITPKDLTGKEKQYYQEWVNAFIRGELNLSKSKHAAIVWLLENTSVNCTKHHIGRCLDEDVRKASEESSTSNTGRKTKKRAVKRQAPKRSSTRKKKS